MTMSPSILIVDDDADTRMLVGRVLSKQGYTILEARDGVTAFAIAQQQRPVLIVLDLGLPGQDGCSLARQLRADPYLEAVPLLAMTGYSANAILCAARHAGCQAIIHKPFTFIALHLATEALLAPPASHAHTTRQALAHTKRDPARIASKAGANGRD